MATQEAISYVGGPYGGQVAYADPGAMEQRVPLPGGAYALEGAGVYRWEADPQRLDRTPRDGDEASALLAEHGGSAPVLEQDVTSSTTIAGPAAGVAPKPQAKTSTGSASRRGLTTKS